MPITRTAIRFNYSADGSKFETYAPRYPNGQRSADDLIEDVEDIQGSIQGPVLRGFINVETKEFVEDTYTGERL